jgi:hypothetical protein
MATPLNGAALELIDELRDAWTSDPRRAAEIISDLQNALRGDLPERGWAIVRRERLQREHKELEQRDFEEREASDTDVAGHDAHVADR